MALKFLNNGYFAGKVGIGTQTPLRGDLVVKGNFQTVSSGNGQLAIISGVLGSNPSDADVGGQMVFGGPISSSDSNRTFGLVGGYKENNTSGDRSGYLSFGTRQNTGSRDIFERMRIDSSGVITFSKTANTNTPAGSINHASNDFVYFTGGTGGASFGDDGQGTRMLAFNSDYLRFDTGDTGEKMRITSTGNVGINTTSPQAFAKLDIRSGTSDGNAAIAAYGYNGVGGFGILGHAYAVDNTHAGSATGIRGISNGGRTVSGSVNIGGYFTASGSENNYALITDSGNVGIGTASPGTALQVGGLDDGSNYDITLGWNAVSSQAVGTKRSALTFKTSQTAVNNEDIYKWDIAMVTAPATASNEPFGSNLAFLRSTRSSTSVDETTMILTQSGNVGIGTDNPANRLVVETSTAGDYAALINNTHSTTGYGLLARTASTGTSAYALAARAASSDIFVVRADGNVGIGTTSPGAKLEISHGGINNGLLLENTLNSSNYQIALNIRENEGLIFQRWIAGAFNGNLMRIGYTGAITFDAYNSTNNTGTPTYLLGTDGSGNVVKTLSTPGGDPGPYLPLAGGTMNSGAAITFVVPSTGGNFINIDHTGNENWSFGAQSGTGVDDYIDIGINGGTRTMSWHEDGKVGIGTISPLFKLQTNATITGGWLGYLNGTSATFGTNNFSAVHNSTAIGTGTESGINLANNASDVGAPSPIISFSAKSASGSYQHAYAAIYGIKTATGADTNWNKGDLVFATGSSTGPNERIRVTSAGNVGIGVTNPGIKLQVLSASEQLTNFSSSVADQLAYSQINASSSTTGTITAAAALELVGQANASGHGRHAWIGAEGTPNTTFETKLKFKIRGAAGGYDWSGSAEAPTIMTLEGTGNVGVGTTGPQSKLQVAGGIQMANDTDTASAAKVGTMRYRTATNEPVPVTGTELVTNGDLASSTGWNLQNSASINNTTGVATVPGAGSLTSTGGNWSLYQSNVMAPNKTYMLRFQARRDAGPNANMYAGWAYTNQFNQTVTAAWVQYQVVFTTGTQTWNELTFGGVTGTTFEVKDITVVEVTEEDASYADMCMQTGASTYEWVNIVRNTY
jgi:hypothetical protein